MRYWWISVLCVISSVSASSSVLRISIRVETPVIVGRVIWIEANVPQTSTRFSCLDLKRDGKLMPLSPICPDPLPTGPPPLALHLIAPGSPGMRYPLYARYGIDRPGKYSVRWRVLEVIPPPPPISTAGDKKPLTFNKIRERLAAQSNWVDFTVSK